MHYCSRFSFCVIIFCSLPEVKRKKDKDKEHLTEEMLDEMVQICLSETDTISLLDMPNTLVSEDADNADILK